MPKDNEVKNLIVNKLTKEQFKTVSDSSTNYEVYHIIDDAHYTEAEIQKLLNTKQDVLTAGDGLEIKDGVISNTHSNPKWGDLQGDVFEQLDLKNALYANNIYESNGLVLTDEQGFNDIQKYAHSTFDISKFVVVGNPVITSDGIYTCGTDTNSYIKIPFDNTLDSFSLDIEFDIKDATQKGNYLGHSSNISYGFIDAHFNGVGATDFRIRVKDNDGNVSTHYMGAVKYQVGINKINLTFTGTYYLLTRTEANGTINTYKLETTNKPATNFFSFGNSGIADVPLTTINLKNITSIINDIPVFSGNKTGLDTIKSDNFEIVGSPMISDNGILKSEARTDYITTIKSNILYNKSWEIISKFTINSENTTTYSMSPIYTFGAGTQYMNWGGVQFSTRTKGLSFNVKTISGTSGEGNHGMAKSFGDFEYGTTFLTKFTYNAETKTYAGYYIRVGVDTDWVLCGSKWACTDENSNILGTNNDTDIISIGLAKDLAHTLIGTSIDLNSFKIYVDGNLVYQPCLKIPYTESKTGSKIVDAVYRDRVKDVYEQFGQANYYTLDEKNKNFTLPMGEIYGMITTSNDRISVLEDEQPIQNMFLTGEISKNKKGYSQLEEMYHSTFDLSKFTVVGAPTITEYGVVSGFSVDNYIKIPNTNLQTADSWEIEGIVQVFTGDTEKCWLSVDSGNGIILPVVDSTKNVNNIWFQLYLSSDVGSWNIANDGGNIEFPSGSRVKCNLKFTGTQYVYTCTNLDTNEIKQQIINSSLKIYQSPTRLGVKRNQKSLTKGDNIDLKQFSITVDGREVFNGNKTGLDVIKPDDYTVVGSPTISADGIFSGNDVNANYLKTGISIPQTSDVNSWEIEFDFETPENMVNDRDCLLGHYQGKDFNCPICCINKEKKVLFYLPRTGTEYGVPQSKALNVKSKYHLSYAWIKGVGFVEKINALSGYTFEDGTTQWSRTDASGNYYWIEPLGIGSVTMTASWKNVSPIDLNTFKVHKNSNLVYQPCLKIPYTISKTGSKIVDVAYRGRVEDVYNQYGQADYYTIDEENENFTLPMGEIYGIINSNLELKANDDEVLHLSGNETKSGNLTVTGTVTSNNFIGNLSGTATKANQDGNGNTISTYYMPKLISTKGIPTNAGQIEPLEIYGRGASNGVLDRINLMSISKNLIFRADLKGATVTCNYNDKVNNLNISFIDETNDGYHTLINPSTDFATKPFIWELISPSQLEATDVCRLYLFGHRLTDPVNCTEYKIEAYILNASNEKEWVTIIDYSGTAVNIVQKGYGLFKTGYSGNNGYYRIYGLRLTISGSTDTVFRLADIRLLSTRGTEKVYDSLHCISELGGKIYGNLTVDGALDAKCTKDSNGNVIVDTYATKTEVGGKQDTLTAGTGINISNNTISTTFTDTKVQSNVSNANSNVPILLNNGASATTNVALINSLINANPSTGTINAQHGKFGKSLTTYRYVASETPNTTYYWYKIYSSSTSDQIVNFEISAHGDANYPYFSKYTISISNYQARTTSVVVHNHGTTKNSDIKVAIDAQGNVYLQTNCLWGCNLNINNTYGTATIPYENMGYSSFGVPVGFTSLGMLTNCGAMRLTKSTGEVQYSNVTTSSIADGVKAKSGQILYDWVGTKEEYEAGIANGTISEDWICWVTDDNAGTYETNKYDLFDVVVKDRILGYEESFGFGKLGTYVYKKPKLNEYLGYPDFYNKCLEEYNSSTLKHFKKYKSNNVKIVGGLKNNNGNLSWFSVNSYATLPTPFNPNANTWEMVFKFNFNSLSAINTIFDTSVQYDGMVIRITTGGKLETYISSNGTSWDIASAKVGTYVFEANKNYWVKAKFNGSQYILSYSTNGVNFINDIIIESTNTLYSSATGYVLGAKHDYSEVLTGELDLKECYININNKRWWTGCNFIEFDYYEYKNGHQFYNIKDKSLVDELFNIHGIAWFYGIDTTNECIFLPRNNYLTSYVENSENSVLYDMQTQKAMRMRVPLSDGLGRINMLFNGVSSSDNTEGLTGANSATDFGRIRYTGQSYKTSNLVNGGTTSTVTPNTLNLDPNGTLYVDIKNTNDSNRYAYMVVGNTVSDTSWVDVVAQVNSGVKELEDKTNEGIKTLSNASNALKQTQITNCLLEVPQNIKLELKDGVLTLKAGSKVIVPNGAGVFNEVVTTQNYSIPKIGDGNGQFRLLWGKAAWSATAPVISYFGGNIESGDTAPTPSGNNWCWYDTANNIVKTTKDQGVTWVDLDTPLPFAVVSCSNGVITSIDQIFNGFGYIGSTIWADKGVKCLIPNGRNEDGSFKNIEFTTSKLIVRTFPDSDNMDAIIGIGTDNVFSRLISSAYSYNVNENINTNGGNPWKCAKLITLTETKGVISNFKPKQPFKAVDYNDIKDNVYIKETYQNGTSWYRVYSDGWCEQGGITSPWYRSTKNVITFLKKFKSKPTFICNLEVTTGEATEMRVTIGNTANNAGVNFITNTQATVYIHGISGSGTDGGPVHWEAKGYIS